jgi:hypothetical protein
VQARIPATTPGPSRRPSGPPPSALGPLLGGGNPGVECGAPFGAMVSEGSFRAGTERWPDLNRQAVRSLTPCLRAQSESFVVDDDQTSWGSCQSLEALEVV